MDSRTTKIHEPVSDLASCGSKWRHRRVGIAMVMDEADIIEAFIRHNLQVLDHLMIVDNGSMDRTWEILQLLTAEKKGRLTLRQDTRVGRHQIETMTALLKEAAHDFSTDWIFALDADEFLFLPETSFQLPDPGSVQHCYRIPWKTYAPSPADDPSQLNPVERLQHRRVNEINHRGYKMVIPGPLARNAGARLGHGNHEFYIGHDEPPALRLENCHLAHFSLRSFWQSAWKTSLRELQIQCDPDYLAKRLDVEHAPYQQIKKSCSILEKEFKRASPAFLYHPWPWQEYEVVPDPNGTKIRTV